MSAPLKHHAILWPACFTGPIRTLALPDDSIKKEFITTMGSLAIKLKLQMGEFTTEKTILFDTRLIRQAKEFERILSDEYRFACRELAAVFLRGPL